MDLVTAILTAVLVIAAIACLCYTCCFSPPCQKIADNIFYDDMEYEVARYEAKYEKSEGENNESV